jgi:phosphoenolpyruvate carboxykinase (ATP)
MWQWWNSIISGEIHLHVNSTMPFLIEKSLQMRLGHLSLDGALIVQSGKFTGRAADDKYIVRDEITEKIIDWSGKVNPLSENLFDELKTEILKKFHLLKHELFIIEASAGAESSYSLGVNLITPSPVHALFSKTIMRSRKEKNALGDFVIFHDPHLEFDTKKYGLRSGTVIAINFKKREILIGGTAYCGEIKKAIFTVMNTILPDLGVLPMHSGANADSKGNVSVFFGLSGTGKTTLSADVGMSLIGDDEHGLSDKGIFNFEGGCYAKTYNLKASLEPEIYKATNRFGSLIENVNIDPLTARPVFEDKSLTENGRATYPLTALENIINDGCGQIPSHFFFLSADAMGVLPLLSQLDHEQAMYYFLLGYTAKVAGTEIGMKGITATFSHCFGAPFMMRHPIDYGKLLKKVLEKHQIKVWLVNTGWSRGPYGVGKRYDLSVTRGAIRAVQNGSYLQSSFVKDSVFGLSLPLSLEGVESRFLRPQTLWDSQDEYFESAKKLKAMFDETFKNLIRREHIDWGEMNSSI